jgi:rubrerythrin
MAEKYLMTINNKRIHEYYKKNPSIDFESMNIVLLDFMDKISTDMSKVLQNTLQGQLLQEVKDIKSQLTVFQESLFGKIAETNKSFLDTLKLLLSMNSSEHSEKIVQLLQKHSETFVDKITNLLPKTQEETQRKIQDQLVLLQKTIQCDFQQFMIQNKPETNLTEFLSTFDSKLSMLQQPIFQMIQSNQEQVSSKLTTVKDDLLVNKTTNERLYNEMSEFLHKYKASSQFKGQYSEHMLETILTEMFPTASVENTTAQTASGDFMIHREGYQDILIENKNYERNVDLDEIKKFLRDVNNKECSGIMMSQLSGIVSKPNFFIEIHNGKVLVYLHKVFFSKEQIKMAIDVIDHLSTRLETIVTGEHQNGLTIRKDVLDKINDEVQLFVKNKEMMTATIKDNSRKLLAQLEELQLPTLTLYLNDKYASIQNQVFVCETCNQSFPTKKGLAMHKKVHK